jgi:hypothetical protein
VLNVRIREPLQEYKNEQLMSDLNEMMIRVKVHLLGIKTGIQWPIPTSKELDDLQNRLNEVLKQDSKPMVKY